MNRAIVLGAVVVVLAIYWLARELGMDRDELLGYAGVSLLLVAVIMVVALVGAGVLRLVRRGRR